MDDPSTTQPFHDINAANEARRFRAMTAIAFRTDLDFEAKINKFLAVGCAEFGTDMGLLAHVEGETFRVEYATAVRGESPLGFECSVRETLCHETLHQPEGLALHEVGASEYRTHAAYVKHKPETYIGAIVWVYGRKYGTLCFNSATPRTTPFADSDREYVRLMAMWAGSELERHTLQEELENRVTERSQALLAMAQREKLLREIGLTIRTSLDSTEIEVQAAQLLGAALSADRCFFAHLELDRDHMEFAADWHRPDLPSVAGVYKPSAFAVDVAPLFRAGGNLVIRDVAGEGWPDATVATLGTLQIQAVIDVPLMRNTDLQAILCVASEHPRQWTDDEIALVEAVAAQTRTSIESATAIQRERRIATTLQDALLPPMPTHVPGMEIGYAYRPALAESNVGGDFYAAYPLDHRTYALVIGDVSGKGLAAASQVSALQNILRYALCAAKTLSEAITQMNTVVIEHSLLAGFATLVVALYDVEDFTLTYCSCGHEPPLVFAADAVEPLRTAGPPLGIADDAAYQERSVQLAPGDTLVFYTDGLSEAGPDRLTLLGTEGLAEIVRRRAEGRSVTETAADVIGDVEAFANGHLQDDACLIIARLTGLPGTDTTQNGIAPAAQENRQPRPLGERMRATPLEEQFRLLVESVTEYAIFLLDTTGHIVTWNKGAERFKGYTASEIVGKHFSIFYTEDDVQRGHPLDELAIAAAEGRYEEEGWRVRKDGTQFWANVVITALRDVDGRLCGYGKVTRDFTERRRAEQQLRLSEERFRLLVQGVQDYAIFMLDPQGFVVSWNEGAQRTKGYTAQEIIGKHFSQFYTEEDRARRHPDHELEIAAAEGRYEEEGWRVRKDGSRFWANVLITALYDAGKLIGFAKVTRDITDRRAAEEGRIQVMRDQISRSFLRDILYSVTEGRLRFCEDDTQLPDHLETRVGETTLVRSGLTDLRKNVAEVAASLGFPQERIADLVTGSSEAAMNAVVHASHAHYTLCASDTVLQVWIMDNGSGIELTQLHRATLERGYTTQNSLGHGFWLMLHTCDRLWLRSTSSGTIIVLEQDAAASEPHWLSRPHEMSNDMADTDDSA